MDALIASFPILMVVVSMLGFGLPAKTALPLGWLATLVVALGYWQQDALTACAWATDGFLESLGTLAIVFGAILSATTGVTGNEGRIIRINLVPCLAYCAIVIVVLGFFA